MNNEIKDTKSCSSLTDWLTPSGCYCPFCEFHFILFFFSSSFLEVTLTLTLVTDLFFETTNGGLSELENGVACGTERD